MIDDGIAQRGLEGYIPKKPGNYPARFFKHMIFFSAETEKLKEEAREKEEDPDKIEDIYKEADYVEIAIPGGDCFVGPASDEHKQKYPREWDSFKKGEEFTDGTPLSEWSKIPKAMLHRMAFLNVFTVEQFWGLNDTTIQQVGMDARRLQAEAGRFLGMRGKQAADEREQAKENRIAELEAKIEALLDQEKKPQGARPRGRPPKKESKTDEDED